KYNIVIIGSGFSGISAANQLSGKGLSILVIDENFHIGGQLLRNIPDKLGVNKKYKPDHVKKIGNRFVDNLRRNDIEILNNTSVIGIYDNNEILVEIEKKNVGSIYYDVILFATGARERYLPFKGWTLPGVFSAGMSQVLMKSSGVLPSRDVVVGGSGLFLFSAAYEFLKNGAKVRSVIESTGISGKMKMLPVLLHNFSKITEGVRYLGKIGLSGVPVRLNTKIVEARGNGHLEEIVFGKCDRDGKIITGKEKIVKTGGFAYSYGFVPNIELPNLAGCEILFNKDLGGWVVKVNENMETSVPGIFCAGEVTGVGGALKSVNEGEIASISILNRFEKGDLLLNKKRKLDKERKHHLDFAKYFNSLYGIREEEISGIPDETIICRCEDVSMGDIRAAVSDGFISPGTLKTSVRAGMGNCQGRTCGPVIYDLL
ncbi:MAG: FAD-dependent oxidoreductase, partial [Candidatus Aminicenantes bacterium]|nr:FAD-dependent oxidoreductase [Candidatus Aminicenantes bacterium]